MSCIAGNCRPCRINVIARHGGVGGNNKFMKKIEYLVIKGKDASVEQFDELGEDGWELVAVCPPSFFSQGLVFF